MQSPVHSTGVRPWRRTGLAAAGRRLASGRAAGGRRGHAGRGAGGRGPALSVAKPGAGGRLALSPGRASRLLYRRKTGRQRSLVDRYAARKAVSEIDASPSPLGWLVRDERQQLVQQALRRLPPRDAELLILKYAEGYGARELAERLGVAVATIETRLHRARNRLRAELADLAAEFEATDHDRH